MGRRGSKIYSEKNMQKKEKEQDGNNEVTETRIANLTGLFYECQNSMV
jgi:hypothetical protein